jgi:RNA polymerase sigma-70 factor (ECF subfamily)
MRKKHISKLPDEEILLRNKTSKTDVYFGKLYCRYIPVLFGVGLKYLHDADKAQDTVMQLFNMLLPEISKQEIKSFRPWIYSAMKNLCRQLLQQEEPKIIVNPDGNGKEPDEIAELFSADDPENHRNRLLRQYLKKLPVEQRIAILRFYTEEMSYRDIADSTGYNLHQVKNYIRSGKQNLKNCMESSKQ